MSDSHGSDEDEDQSLSTHFRTQVLESEDERMAAFRLRHQVYTLEQSGKDEFDPEAFEKDANDERATIIAAFSRRDNRIAGTLRLIKRYGAADRDQLPDPAVRAADPRHGRIFPPGGEQVLPPPRL